MPDMDWKSGGGGYRTIWWFLFDGVAGRKVFLNLMPPDDSLAFNDPTFQKPVNAGIRKEEALTEEAKQRASLVFIRSYMKKETGADFSFEFVEERRKAARNE